MTTETKKFDLNTARTLVLNADMAPLSYNPLSVWRWEDAISAIVKKKAYVVANYDTTFVHSPSVTMNVPSVIALNNYIYNSSQVRFTRYNIYLRDKFTCVYCGIKYEAKDLSFDHIIPRSKGGTTTWENICSACIQCNQIKNDRSLDENIIYPKGHFKAGQRMKLLYKAYAPTHEQFRRADRMNYDQLHHTWIDFLYWSNEIDSD